MALAVAVATADIRARAKSEGTGFVRSPDTEKFAQAFDRGSNVHEGRSHLPFPATTLTQPWSALEYAVKLEELEEMVWGQPHAPSLSAP